MGKLYRGILEALNHAFGTNVKICDRDHIQVSMNGHTHNIWIDQYGRVKLKLSGRRSSKKNSVQAIIDDIAGYDHGPPIDRAPADELVKFIGKSTGRLEDKELSKAIFVDAGWKDGRAKISIVKIDGPNVEAKAYTITSPHINDAELEAIKAGLAMSNNEIPIFSDSEPMVNHVSNPLVHWIPRKHNKAADALASLRKRRAS